MKNNKPRRPSAFALDELNLLSPEERPAANATTPSLVGDPDPFAEPEGISTVPVGPGRGWRWSRLLLGALGGLIALAIGLAIDNLIRELFTRTDWLGWLGISLAALATLALAALAVREIVGLLRLRLIDDIRQRATAAADTDDRNAARASARELISLYLAFGMSGIGAAVLGELADITSIQFVFLACSFLPAIGLLTVFLPDLRYRPD